MNDQYMTFPIILVLRAYTSFREGHWKKWLPRWPNAKVDWHMSGVACNVASLVKTVALAKRRSPVAFK